MNLNDNYYKMLDIELLTNKQIIILLKKCFIILTKRKENYKLNVKRGRK